MTRVLVVWEDAGWKVLGALTKRLVSTAPGGVVDRYPTVVGHTTEGNGRFAHYVEVTWPRVRAAGLPVDKGPIDHVVCVLDADRAHELVPAIGAPPKDAASVSAWHSRADVAWSEWLRQRCPADGPATTTVHGLVLRWAKESVVLAGFDQAAAATHLDVSVEHAEVAALLQRECGIDPRGVADAVFTDTFHRPLSCVDQMRRARNLSPIPKNATAIDDMIRDLTRQSLSIVRARVPDLARLADRIWELHRGS